MAKNTAKNQTINTSQEAKHSIEISVADLQVGMYVSKLDCDWMDTPFLMQGFMIENDNHLGLLAEYCNTVWVDKIYKQQLATGPKDAILHASTIEKQLIHKKTTADELNSATGIYAKSKEITKNLMQQVRLGNAIDSQAAKNLVSDCVTSILNNPDALMWVSKIRDQDEYTAEHSVNVCVLTIALARRLGFNEAELNKVGLCGLLHDVGKLQIDPAILNKTDPLTREEWQIIAAHPANGRNLLMGTPSIYPGAIDVAYSHHERIDGKGYPRGLSGSAISTFSRVVAITDAYDAMTANRCYASAKSSTDALKVLFHAKDKHFDGKMVDVFMRIIGLYPPGTLVEMKNGCVGVVLSSNEKKQHLPEVIMCLDKNKNRFAQKTRLDLRRIEDQDLDESYLIKQAHIDGSFGLQLEEFLEEGFQFKSFAG